MQDRTCMTPRCPNRPRYKSGDRCSSCLNHVATCGTDPSERSGLRDLTPGVCAVGPCENLRRNATNPHCDTCYNWARRHGGAHPSGRFANQPRRGNGLRLEELRAAAEATTDECMILGGYGGRPVARLGDVQMNASRAVWIIAKGDPGALSVLHLCHRGQEGCVNIRHLYCGDQDQNLRDMVEAGRSLKGEACPSHKLTDGDVMIIRREYVSGACYPDPRSKRALAERFGVDPATVGYAVRRKTWRHLP